jgi:hypothetical protein
MCYISSSLEMKLSKLARIIDFLQKILSVKILIQCVAIKVRIDEIASIMN